MMSALAMRKRHAWVFDVFRIFILPGSETNSLSKPPYV
jgi:hypothetical protein